jgi:ABC-type transport system substrate-binding protein
MEPSLLIPGLATEWKVSDNDTTKWVLKLRSRVKFHDGSDFNADAVVRNLRTALDKEVPHCDATQVSVTASRMPTLDWRGRSMT